MYPHERSLVRKLADKPFTIIGVNSDQDLEGIREVVKEKGITWRSFQNSANDVAISEEWGVRGWPTTYLIDQDGIIRFANVRGDDLDAAIEELMAEMNHDVELVGVDHKAEDKAARAAAESN